MSKQMYITHLLDSPIKGKISVIAIDDHEVKTNRGIVVITLLMTDGFELISHLKFPVTNRVRLSLSFTLDGEPWEVTGFIQHKKSHKGYLQKYIFRFLMDDRPLYEAEFRNMLKELAVRTAWNSTVQADEHLH